MKIQKDRMIFFVGFLTIEVYWPHFMNNNSNTGVYAPSQVSYKKYNKAFTWCMHRAFVFKVVGFGIGLAWKHCDNPNLKLKEK